MYFSALIVVFSRFSDESYYLFASFGLTVFLFLCYDVITIIQARAQQGKKEGGFIMVKLYFIKDMESLKRFICNVHGSAVMHIGDSVQFDLKNEAAGFEVLKQLSLGAGNVSIRFTEKADANRFVHYLITA